MQQLRFYSPQWLYSISVSMATTNNAKEHTKQSKAIAENKNAIVASCWTYFTTIKHDARNHKY